MLCAFRNCMNVANRIIRVRVDGLDEEWTACVNHGVTLPTVQLLKEHRAV